MNTILIVEDNKDMSFLLTNILEDEGFSVRAVGNGSRALDEVPSQADQTTLDELYDRDSS